MGGVAAVFFDRGAPVDRPLFHRICHAVPFRAADGVDAWFGDGAAVARLRAAADGERDVPLVDAARGLVLAFDGRLDNRDELAEALHLHGAHGDAQLALEAIVRWDVDAPSHMLGDFAFVAWDIARRRAVLGRDHMGLRPLHYALNARGLVCGSDMAHVLADGSVARHPNLRVVAQYLACEMRNGAETLYEGVSRVPPAHCVVFEDGVVRQHRYWTAEARVRVRYRSDDEYADHCRELLVRSVAARLRSDSPVAATLSGGIDSSSVALVAHRLVEHRRPPTLFSMVYPDHPESDERPYINAVAERCGATPVYVPPTPATRSLPFRAAAWMDAPAMAADQSCEGMWNAIRDAGCRVALTGAGGDFVYAGSIFQYADLLRSGRLIALLRRYRADGAADDTGRGPLALIQAGVWPALPIGVKRLLRPIAVRAATRLGIVTRPPWLRLPLEKDDQPERPRGGSFAVEDLIRGLTGGFHSYVLEGSERAAAEAGVELRHPLLDVRLTEFVIGLPEEQRRRGPILKFVLRRALRDELPPLVANRTTKGDFAHAVWDAVESLGGERFYRSLAIADAGWVDGRAALGIYRQMRDDLPLGHRVYGRHVPEIWMITALELWFRAAFAGARAAAL